MKERNTFSLFFYIRTDRLDNSGMATLYLRISSNGEKIAFSINRKVESTSWDISRGMVNPRTKDASEVNNFIQSLKSKAYEAYRQLLDEQKVVTPSRIKEIIFGTRKRDLTLIQLVEQHNKQMEAGIGYSSTYGNFKNFKTTLNYLKEFVHYTFRKTDIMLSEVDQSFISDYCLFIQKVKNCGNNGTMKHLQRLKKVMNIALENEWIIKSPFARVKIKFHPYDKIILTKEELEIVENLYVNSPKLALVKDAFILSCYTGLSYVDLKNLTRESIVLGIDETPWIITRRQKTDIKARIPLLPKAIDLIDKYKEHPKLKGNHVFPMYSNQKMNDYLKELAKLAGIEKSISFHCGRHIFATVITLANGVPIETVSKALGHTDIRTTQIYSRVLDEKIAFDFDKLRKSLNID